MQKFEKINCSQASLHFKAPTTSWRFLKNIKSQTLDTTLDQLHLNLWGWEALSLVGLFVSLFASCPGGYTLLPELRTLRLGDFQGGFSFYTPHNLVSKPPI